MLTLSETIIEHGVDKVRFTIPCNPLRSMLGLITFSCMTDEPVMQECVIDESHYKVAGNHKITLRPVDPAYASQDFYFMDLRSMMRMYPDRYRMTVVE